MLDIHISVGNPFRRGDEAVARDVFVLDAQIARHKNLEIQLSRWSRIVHIIELELDTRFTGRDHAGPRIYVGLLGFFLSLQIYDHRHWDYENGRWDTHDRA